MGDMMTQEQSQDTLNSLVEQGKELVARGNKRHLIIRTQDGEALADVSLTVAAIVGLVLLFAFPWGWTLALIAGVIGVVARVRVEVVRELTEQDETLQVEQPEKAEQAEE